MRTTETALVWAHYSRLTICGIAMSRRDINGGIRRYVKVKCDCGVVKETHLRNLTQGRTRSCGCLQLENISKAVKTHGLTKTPEYWAWRSMRNRCYNPDYENYHNYGLRGITVCEEWKNNFLQFLQDMGKRPANLHSLERVDNEKGYSKENCKWATWKEQENNRRDNLNYNTKRGGLL